MATKVTLMRQCKTDKGWRRYPVVIGGNGRVRPNWVVVAGKEVEYPEGYYQIRTYANGKTVWRSVGSNASDALAARDRETKLLAAKELAKAAGVRIMEDPEREHITRQLTQFIRVVTERGSGVAAQVYRLSAEDFITVSGRQYVDQVTPDDVLAYHQTLRKRGVSQRTIHNRHMNLMAFLRHCGMNIKILAPKAPRFEKTMPEVYGDELKRFFASLTQTYHKLLFEFLLSTGFREQEVTYLEWSDLDPKTKTAMVRSKPHYKFKVKDNEERSVPVPADLMGRVFAYRQEGMSLVFGTKRGRPNTKMLRLLKTLVYDAGLNCRQCKTCLTRCECEKWFLHKFRATFCTKLLRSGLDLRTVQYMMGHSDMASTMRYLRPAEGQEVQTKVNAINWI